MGGGWRKDAAREWPRERDWGGRWINSLFCFVFLSRTTLSMFKIGGKSFQERVMLALGHPAVPPSLLQPPLAFTTQSPTLLSPMRHSAQHQGRQPLRPSSPACRLLLTAMAPSLRWTTMTTLLRLPRFGSSAAQSLPAGPAALRRNWSSELPTPLPPLDVRTAQGRA